MRRYSALLLLALVLSACVTGRQTKLEKYTPIQESLTYLTQKVEGYYGKAHISRDFSEVQYMKALEEVCYPFATCKARVDDILSSYELKARSVDGGIITVMLCKRDDDTKVMEDFSCDNSRVEVRSWEEENPEKCEFEPNWADVIQKDCRTK